MSTSTTRTSGFWLNWGSSKTTDRDARRRSRRKSHAMRRLEFLEDRTLLDASMVISSSGALVYATDNATDETLYISVSGTTYTFESSVVIDVTNNSGLTVSGGGTQVVTVTGLPSDITLELNHAFDMINLMSSKVDVAINLNSNNAFVELGTTLGVGSLNAITAPVTVTGPGVATTNVVSLADHGGTGGGAYTVTPTTVTNPTGFGGLTYSGVSNLNLTGTAGGNTYTVQGTADGVATRIEGGLGNPNRFTVEGTSADPASSLTLEGGIGLSEFNILAASSPVEIAAGGGTNAVNLGNAGVTADLASSIIVANTRGGTATINLDNAAGAAAGAWNLAAQAAPSTLAELTGFSATGSLLYDPVEITSLNLTNAAGLANSLTIDFGHGSPVTATASLAYNGGGAASDNNLILKGGSITDEIHNARTTGGGEILVDGRLIVYSGIAPSSVYDVAPATNYTFNNIGDPGIPVVVKEGANSALTGNVQALLITSPGSFVDTHIANKTNVTVNADPSTSGGSVVVNYGITTSAAGLASLTLTTNGGDDTADLIALPPGVAASLHQGAGDDLATVSIPGTAGATSTTLNGGSGDNTLVLDAGGLAITPGNFAAGAGGTTVISGAPLPGAPITYSNYQHVTVNNLPPVLPVVTGATINAVQGARLVDAIAGTFTTTAAGAKAGDFTATIAWGDGTSSAGSIVQDASNPSIFYVMGTHTYWENSSTAGYTTTISVSSSGSTLTQIINGVPVTFVTSAGGVATADGTAVVANAPIDLTVSSFSGFENITPSPSMVVVATFVDQGGVNPGVADPVSRYIATINWGDDSGVTTIPTSAITQNADTNSFNITLPQHVYSTPGTYVVTVTVSDGALPGANNPVTATATGVAHVMDAPLTAASPQPAITDATEGVVFTDKVLASFTDANPLATADEFAVTIDWGDGSPLSHGRVIQPGGVGTPFFVVGTHAYANAQRSTNHPTGTSPVSGPVTTDGNYPIRIFVQDTYGSAVNLFNTIKVLDKAVTVAGKLNPASDSGISHSDAITSVQQPNFQGTASEAGALVFLYATPIGGGTPALIGQTNADANGAWSITSNTPLADGGYVIQAQAYDASGNSISALTTVTPALVVDTVGPKITDVYLDNFNGQVIFTIEDLGGIDNNGTGVVLASLTDANNYKFSMIYSPVRGYRGAPQWLVTGVDVQPGTNVGEQTVIVQINDGRPIRGGHYSFSILSADSNNASGVRDVAGNALDGEFYSFFPSGNNVRGGNFVTRLDAVHDINYAPKTLIGPGSPVTPPGRPGQTVIIGRNIPRPRAALAAAMAARQANRPGLALAAARPRLAPRFAR